MLSTLKPLMDRGLNTARGASRELERLGRRASSDAIGLVRRAGAARGGPKTGMDDQTLAHKVETELFRTPGVAKGKIDVNVVDGVVWLRGEVKNPSQVKSLETRARRIAEVQEVQNLLHLPRTPSPTRTDTPASQRKTRRNAQKPARPRGTGKRFNSEREVPGAEPAPTELAARRKGRQAAPLGSSGQGGGGTKAR